MGGGAGAALAEVMLGWIGSQPMGMAYAKARKTGGGGRAAAKWWARAATRARAATTGPAR